MTTDGLPPRSPCLVAQSVCRVSPHSKGVSLIRHISLPPAPVVGGVICSVAIPLSSVQFSGPAQWPLVSPRPSSMDRCAEGVVICSSVHTATTLGCDRSQGSGAIVELDVYCSDCIKPSAADRAAAQKATDESLAFVTQQKNIAVVILLSNGA